MYGMRSTQARMSYICLLFWGFSNACHFNCFLPTALELARRTNFDMLFLVMGFICLLDEI